MKQNKQTKQAVSNIHSSPLDDTEILEETEETTKFQSKEYFLTYHIKDGDSVDKQISKLLQCENLFEKYIFAEEWGKSGKTHHIQGAFICKTKQYATKLEKLFTNGVTLRKLKNWSWAFNYCQKEPYRKWTSEKIRKPLQLLDETKLYDYQEMILKIIAKEPDDRTITWCIGDYGIGKTKLLKLICAKYNGYILPTTKSHALSQIYKREKQIDDTIYCINLTGDTSNYQKNEFFDIMECLKDGLFPAAFGTECNEMCIFNPRHLIVMANKEPDFKVTKIDKHRFNIFNVGKDYCEQLS